MNDIEIVDFTEKYIPDVLNVLYESNIMHIKSDPDYFAKTGKERSLPYLYWILHDPENFGYVALHDGEVAGIVLAGIEKRNENVYRVPIYIEVYDIAVSSRHVKLGIGRKLHDKVLERAREERVKQVELIVYSFNRGAMEFYKKLHYREVSRTMVIDV